jgi:hypothetical protein
MLRKIAVENVLTLGYTRITEDFVQSFISTADPILTFNRPFYLLYFQRKLR